MWENLPSRGPSVNRRYTLYFSSPAPQAASLILSDQNDSKTYNYDSSANVSQKKNEWHKHLLHVIITSLVSQAWPVTFISSPVNYALEHHIHDLLINLFTKSPYCPSHTITFSLNYTPNNPYTFSSSPEYAIRSSLHLITYLQHTWASHAKFFHYLFTAHLFIIQPVISSPNSYTPVKTKP